MRQVLLVIVALFISATVKQVNAQVVVYTKDIKNITNSSATCFYSITMMGNPKTHGVCVGIQPNPEVNKNGARIFKGTVTSTAGAQLKECDANITGIKPLVTLYVRAYAQLNDGSFVYGNEKSFTTLSDKAKQ